MFAVHAFHRKLACEANTNTYTASLVNVYIYSRHVGFWEAQGPYKGPGVLGLSFVKEPRGPRWG